MMTCLVWPCTHESVGRCCLVSEERVFFFSVWEFRWLCIQRRRCSLIKSINLISSCFAVDYRKNSACKFMRCTVHVRVTDDQYCGNICEYVHVHVHDERKTLANMSVRTCRCFAKLPALDRLWNSKQIQLRPKRRRSSNYALEAAVGRWWLRLSWSEERKKLRAILGSHWPNQTKLWQVLCSMRISIACVRLRGNMVSYILEKPSEVQTSEDFWVIHIPGTDRVILFYMYMYVYFLM